MRRFISSLSFALAVAGLSACETPVTAESAEPSAIFQTAWNSGQQADEPAYHVQTIDQNTVAIRQSLRHTFEAPFLYLIFGNDRALLIDTGVEGADLRGGVEAQLSAWAAANDKAIPELIVMHSHGHGDHTGGDDQFVDRPDTVLVGLEAEAIEAFFGIDKIGRAHV